MDWGAHRWQRPSAYNPYLSGDESTPGPLNRRRITEILPVGVKAIDGLITVGKGQRMGILSGSGVGRVLCWE